MYSSIADILEQSEKNKKEFWEVVMEADMESRDVSREASRQKMKQMLDVMKDADWSYEGDRKSASGLSGGDGKLLEEYNRTGKNLCGAFLGKVMERAVKMGESNACMKRIVAAPTAGSCGVIPAVLLSYEEYCKPSEDDLINALSPKDEKGQPIYKDTADFESKFIKGTPDAEGAYSGDPESVTFVNTLLKKIVLRALHIKKFATFFKNLTFFLGNNLALRALINGIFANISHTAIQLRE